MAGEWRRLSVQRELYWKEVESMMGGRASMFSDSRDAEALYRMRHNIPAEARKFVDHDGNVVFEWFELVSVCRVVGSPALVAGHGRAAVAGLPTFLAAAGMASVEPLTEEEAEWLNSWPSPSVDLVPRRRRRGPCVFELTPGDVFQRFEVRDGG